jgi:hypothetical protein
MKDMFMVVTEDESGDFVSEPEFFETETEAVEFGMEEQVLEEGETVVLYDVREKSILQKSSLNEEDADEED